MPEIGTTIVNASQSATERERDPLPPAQGQQLLARRLALHRHEFAGGLEQPALHQHERERDRDDAHRDRRHQVIRRRAELVGELVQVGREHEVSLGVAEDEGQAEDLEAEEENQHRRIEKRRHRHRQAHVERDAQRIRADDARRFLDVGPQALQRGPTNRGRRAGRA
jgi:hypothetical protein